MKKFNNIGLVIADVQEYAPINALCEKYGGVLSEQFGDKLSVLSIKAETAL